MKKHFEEKTRNAEIMKAGAASIGINLVISLTKIVIGIATSSFAIILDAVNGLAAVLSGGLMIFEAKLSGKTPDAEHPLGYGRIEYVTAILVSGVICYTGVTTFVESLKKIRTPEIPEYNAVTIGVLGLFLVIKLFLSKKIKKNGKRLNSKSLFAIGKLAGLEEALSLSVLVAACLYMQYGILLEAYVGLAISIVILKIGYQMVRDTVGDILGTRVDADLSRKIKSQIGGYAGVSGAYDLIINSYGPEKQIGSVHIEVPDTMTAREIDDLSRRIAKDVLKTHNVLLTGIGVYARNTTDCEEKRVEDAVAQIVRETPGLLEMHGFHMNAHDRIIHFDLVISFAIADRDAVLRDVKQEIDRRYPDYTIDVTEDIDI